MGEYDSFKAAFEKGSDANKLALQDEVSTTESILAKLKAYKDKSDQKLAENPLPSWAGGMANVGAAVGSPAVAVGQAVHGLRGEEPQRVTVPAPDTTTSPGGSFTRPGEPPVTSASALPDANVPLKPAMGAGMGPGGDTATEKAVRGSQQDYLGDLGGLQAKKEETYAAHLKGMETTSDLQQEAVERGKVAAAEYQRVVDEDQQARANKDLEVQRAQDEATSKGIDPGRYYRNRDVGFWINVGIGSVASGMLAAMNGGSGNAFTDQMNKMVNDDIHAQEVGIQQGLRKAQNAETAYERMRMRGIDSVTAAFKQHDWTMQSIQDELKARLGKAQIPEEAKRLEEALQEVQIKRDQETVKYNEYWNNIAHQKASAAAAMAAAQAKAAIAAQERERKWEMDKSQIVKNYAEAEKTGKEAKAPPPTEAEKATTERDANLRAVSAAAKDVDSITGGSGIGTAWSHLPGVVPGVASATQAQQPRESYNRRVMMSVAAAYKLSTDATEPKNKELLEHFADPFIIKPGDNKETALLKMKTLEQLIGNSAEAKGAGQVQPGISGLSTFEKKK